MNRHTKSAVGSSCAAELDHFWQARDFEGEEPRQHARGRGRAALFGCDKLEQMAAAEGVSRVCVRRMNQNGGNDTLDSLTLLISVRVN
jgi:hypothetical protein